MTYWYVLFVLTGYEEKVKDKINEYNIEEVEAFIPKKTKHFKIKGQVIKKEEILFKGYVFENPSYLTKSLRSFYRKISSISLDLSNYLNMIGKVPNPSIPRKENFWSNSQTKKISSKNPLDSSKAIRS